MKTIEEKAEAYADRPTTAKTWGMSRIVIEDAYIAGATEALAGLWKDPSQELPEIDHNNAVLVRLKKDYAGMTYQSAYYVGDGIFRNPECVNLPVVAWSHIPKNESE